MYLDIYYSFRDERYLIIMEPGLELATNNHFYQKLQLVVKDVRQRVVSVVPLESSNNTRLRYLVLVSGPTGNNNTNMRHQRCSPSCQPHTL